MFPLGFGRMVPAAYFEGTVRMSRAQSTGPRLKKVCWCAYRLPLKAQEKNQYPLIFLGQVSGGCGKQERANARDGAAIYVFSFALGGQGKMPPLPYQADLVPGLFARRG